jgi:hypothetical protein
MSIKNNIKSNMIEEDDDDSDGDNSAIEKMFAQQTEMRKKCKICL